MKMRCFCVPIVSLSFWIQSVISVCDLCDPHLLYEGGVCVSVFACVLTRESRTKQAGVEGFVSATMRI